MSDYLSRAAERASGVPAGVRPVLPSAFDSDSSSFAPALVEAENTSRVEPSRNIADEQVASVHERVASVKALSIESAQRAPAQKSEAGINQISVEIMRAPVVAPAVATSPAKLDRDDPETAAVSSPGKDAIPPRRGPKTDSLPRLAERSNVPPRPAPSESVEDKSPPPMIGKPMAPRAAPVQASKTSGARPISPDRRPDLKVKSSPDPFTSADDSPSAGAIYVTIGRIEVRAIHPPAEPAPPRPPPKPTLSLDDYLKQRNGGARE